jgi:hypothetical protein
LIPKGHTRSGRWRTKFLHPVVTNGWICSVIRHCTGNGGVIIVCLRLEDHAQYDRKPKSRLNFRICGRAQAESPSNCHRSWQKHQNW